MIYLIIQNGIRNIDTIFIKKKYLFEKQNFIKKKIENGKSISLLVLSSYWREKRRRKSHL